MGVVAAFGIVDLILAQELETKRFFVVAVRRCDMICPTVDVSSTNVFNKRSV